MPLIPGLSVALLNQGDITEFSFEVELREEEFSLSLFALSAAIRFESSLLKRMKPVAGGFEEESPDPVTGEPQPIEVSIEGADLSFNSNGEFTFSFADGASSVQHSAVHDRGQWNRSGCGTLSTNSFRRSRNISACDHSCRLAWHLP